jgi:hypothetical protein
MRDGKLEFLSDEVRKGNPIGLKEAMEVVAYQQSLKKLREERSEKRFRMVKGLVSNLVCVIGGMALILGEVDDSPGLGGIGLILIISSMYLNSKLLYDINK